MWLPHANRATLATHSLLLGRRREAAREVQLRSDGAELARDAMPGQAPLVRPEMS